MNKINRYINKNFIVIIVPVLLSVFHFSCSTEVEIVDSSKDIYIVNAVLNADSSTQYITVSKNYFVDNADPYENLSDPFIKDAEVSLSDSEGNNVNFVPASIPRPEGARYNSDLNYYKAENFKPKENTKYNLEVKVNDIALYSDLETPQLSRIYIDTKAVYPVFGLFELKFDWRFYIGIEDIAIYKPALFLNYFVKTENGLEKRKMEIPQRYDSDLPNAKKIYPPVTNYLYTDYRYEIIDRTILSLEPDSLARQNIFLHNLEFELTTMDVDLGSYYILSKTNNSGFTVLLDYNDFTNIENGLGIFGITKKHSTTIGLVSNFVKSHGFNYINP